MTPTLMRAHGVQEGQEAVFVDQWRLGQLGMPVLPPMSHSHLASRAQTSRPFRR